MLSGFAAALVAAGMQWAQFSEAELIARSEVIVVAELTGVTASPDRTAASFGVLLVEEVLRGAISSSSNELLLMVPSPGGLRSSSDIFYRRGQRGLWFLRARTPGAEGGPYLADHPQRFVSAADNRFEELRNTLKSHQSSSSPLQGSWKLEEISVIGGPNAGTNSSPQASLWIFTEHYYSESYVNSAEPRSLIQNQPPTDAEKIAAYDSFIFNAGTYELESSTVVFHPSVARSPNFMSGGSKQYDFRVEGDVLWLIQKPGQNQQFTEIRRKLTRLE